MNRNDEVGRSAVLYRRVAWPIAALLVGLAIGTLAGPRLATSRTETVFSSVAVARAPVPLGVDETASRLAERTDRPAISPSATDAELEPGASIAAYDK